MSAGVRDVVIITGITGYGKSTWLEQYLKKYKRLIIFDPFRAIPAEYISGDTLIEKHESGELKTADKYRYGIYTLFDLPLAGAIAYLNGNCAFVIEECGFAFRKGQPIPDWLQEGIFLGRHQFLSMIFTAQRAISIPIELRSQSNRFITFRQTEPEDVKWCREKLGDLIEELPLLPKYTCFDAEDNSVSRYMVGAPRMPVNPVAAQTPQAQNNDAAQNL